MILITPEMALKMRQRVKDLEQGGLADAPIRELAERLAPEFPQFKPKTLKDYVSSFRAATDLTMKRYQEGLISSGVMTQLTQGIDSAEQDFVAGEYLKRKMIASELSLAKQHRKDGASWAEALGKATGEIPTIKKPSQQQKHSEVKSYDQLLKEILELGTQWRMKVAMALELVPPTVLQKGEALTTVFMKTYELRHLIGEQYEFVDKKVKQFIEEIEKHAHEEATVAASRREQNKVKEARNDERDHVCVGSPEAGFVGDGGQEAEVVPLGEVGEAVQDAPQDVRGEGP